MRSARALVGQGGVSNLASLWVGMIASVWEEQWGVQSGKDGSRSCRVIELSWPKLTLDTSGNNGASGWRPRHDLHESWENFATVVEPSQTWKPSTPALFEASRFAL